MKLLSKIFPSLFRTFLPRSELCSAIRGRTFCTSRTFPKPYTSSSLRLSEPNGLLAIVFFLLAIPYTLLATPSVVSAQGIKIDLDALGRTEQEPLIYFETGIDCIDNGTNFIECTTRNITDGLLNEAMGMVGVIESPAVSAGLLPASTKALAYLFQPTVTTSEYIAYVGQNLGVNKAYAQGAGYKALSPVLTVWTGFRNIAYFIFVLIFIAVGFMIMFRTKINPQTVISLQEALPRLILTLVIVTFSYAIAGFMIDMMYLLTYLAISVFDAAGLAQTAVVEKMLDQNIVITFVKDFIIAPFRGNWGTSQTIGEAITLMIGDILNAVVSSGVLWIAGKALAIVIGIIILWSVGRTFFILLESYLTIIILVILSPLLLIFNALPSSNAFITWAKNLLANILVFPGVAVFIMLAGALIGSDTLTGAQPVKCTANTGFVPPFLGFAPCTGGLQALIGFGMILLLPAVAQMIKDALKVEAIKYRQSVFAGFAPITWLVKTKIKENQERKAALQQEQSLRNALNPGQG